MLDHVMEYVDKLDTAAEDRLLTTRLIPANLGNGEAGCVVGVATGVFRNEDDWKQQSISAWEHKMNPRSLGLDGTAVVV